MPSCPGMAAVAAAGCTLLANSACSSNLQPTLDEVRQAAERYRDVKTAIADGYTTDNKCVTAEMLGNPAESGAMGLHYVRRDLLGLADQPQGRVAGTGTHTDFLKPAMLVYEPQADGTLELVAVENLVFKSAWEAAGNRQPPTFRGHRFLLLADNPGTRLDEAHNYEPHYELHAWVFRDNPLGMFAPFNPKVSCRHLKPVEATGSDAAMHSSRAALPHATEIRSIGVAEARTLVAGGALLIDVRDPDELIEDGWLQGAVNRPLSALREQARALPRDRAIILYCRSGRRSAIARELLTSLGFSRVYDLGGYRSALRAGMPKNDS